MAYNYHKAVVADLEKMIRENLDSILENFEAKSLEEINRDELEEYIKDEAWTDDYVTGNGGGYYFKDIHEAGEALLGNERKIAEALYAFGDETKLGSGKIQNMSPEYFDTSVRCFELYNGSADEAIDNVIESPDKQVAEEEILKVPKGELPYYDYKVKTDYDYKVRTAIENYVSENVNELLEEADINSVEDYTDLKDLVLNKIFEGEIDVPLPSDSDIIYNMDEAFDNDLLCDCDYTIEEYFSKSDVKNLVKNCYAEEYATEELSNALENIYEEVIQPAIEQREAEQDFDRD